MIDRHWGGLMAAGQAGDRGAYRRLLEETRTWLQRYYAHRLPSSMIEDATQEALIAIHNKRHTYDPSRPFGPWLATIARYKWIDRLRTLKSLPTETLSDDLPTADHAEAATSAVLLDQLLGTLKPAQSEVIRLVKIYGLSIEETSVRTGQSASLVKVNIHRGLSLLTKMAQQESYAEG